MSSSRLVLLVQLLLNSFTDRPSYPIQDLDIDKLVKGNTIAPGQYMILKFNFAVVEHAQDLNTAAKELSANITWSLKEFCRDYHMYFGKSAQDLISENVDDGSAISSLRKVVSYTNRTLLEVKRKRDTEHPLAKIKGVSHQ